jgi:hypothetical protein
MVELYFHPVHASSWHNVQLITPRNNCTLEQYYFWDITQCSPLEVSRRFAETYRLHLHGSLLNLFFDPEDGGDIFLREYRLIFNRLHGVILGIPEDSILHNYSCEILKSYVSFFN